MVVITDIMGKTGSKLAMNLIQRGVAVRGIDGSRQHMAYLISEGVEAAIGNIEDAVFMTSALKDADALFLILPLSLEMGDFRGKFNRTTAAVEKAVRDIPLRTIYLFSSMGADESEEAGFLSALREVELKLDNLQFENVITIRSGYYMDHFLNKLALLKSRNILGDCIDGDTPLYLVHNGDVAANVANMHVNNSFFGRSRVELYGDLTTMRQAAKVIGQAIDEPELVYRLLSDKEMRNYYLEAGYSTYMANTMVETSHAINRGVISPSLIDPQVPNCPTRFDEYARKVLLPLYKTGNI